MPDERSERMGDRAEQVVSSLAAKEYESVIEAFAPKYESEFVEFLPPTYEPYLQLEPAAVLEEHWRSATSLYGEFDSVVETSTDDRDENVVVDLTLQFATDTYPLRLAFDADEQITGIEFPAEYEPPAYVDADGFTERELSIQSDGLELGATLSVPDDVDDPPGVVLVHGAGGNNRNYAAGPNKFLQDLAWGLASNGITVLRYDKRSFVVDIPPEDHHIDTVVVDDAVAAATQFSETDAVDSDRLFVVGHSLGSMCAPRIAARHGGLAGIGMLDAIPRPFTETMPRIIRDRWKRDGAISEYGERQIEMVESETDRVESGDVGDDEVVLGFPGAWWTSLYDYDHVSEARSLSLPTFVGMSGRDTDLYEAGVKRWRDELSERRLRAEYYDDLNHYYQRGSLAAAYLEPVVFRKPPAETVIADLASWLTETAS